MASLAATVQQQAEVMTYSQAFYILGIAMLGMIPLLLLLRRPPPGGMSAQAAQAAH